MAEEESKQVWQFNFLMNSGRTVTQEVELSEPHTTREACEFIIKQLERGLWWSLDDDLVIRTDRVETFFVGDLEREEDFLNKDED